MMLPDFCSIIGACATRAQKKTCAHKAVCSLAMPDRCATMTRTAKCARFSTMLRWTRLARWHQPCSGFSAASRKSAGKIKPYCETIATTLGIQRIAASPAVNVR